MIWDKAKGNGNSKDCNMSRNLYCDMSKNKTETNAINAKVQGENMLKRKS